MGDLEVLLSLTRSYSHVCISLLPPRPFLRRTLDGITVGPTGAGIEIDFLGAE
jgi:hypothetical protein